MTVETQSPRDTSRCRITSACGFSFCSRCGGNDYDDRPFACTDQTSTKGSEAMATRKTKTATTAAKKAEPPPQMQREDRRIITEKLDDVYSDKGYLEPWTDAAVARDLNVPRAWVAEVREAFFGPEDCNPTLLLLEQTITEIGAGEKRAQAMLVKYEEDSKMVRNAFLDLQAKLTDARALYNKMSREARR